MRLTRGLAGWLMLGVAAPASGQVFYGVSGGVGVAGPNPNSPGLLAQASLGHVGSRGSGWRVDAFAAGVFQVTHTFAVPAPIPFGYGMCAITGAYFGEADHAVRAKLIGWFARSRSPGSGEADQAVRSIVITTRPRFRDPGLGLLR